MIKNDRSCGKMKDSKEIILSRIDFEEETIAQYCVKELKRMGKEEFGKFSAIITVLFTIGIWFVKGLWYVFWSGRFSVYNIDRNYINADSENVLLEIIEMGAVLIIWLFVNYVYYRVTFDKDNLRFTWKYFGKKVLFWGIEMGIVFFCWFRNSLSNLLELFTETGWMGVLLVILLMWFTCFLINLFALEYIGEIKRIKRKERKKEKTAKKRKRRSMKELIFLLGFTASFELVMFFFLGTQVEQGRSGFKMIMTKVNEDTETKYSIQSGEEDELYKVFPIVYENGDCYILTRLYKEEGEIKIDYDYQQVIGKENVETTYTNNIFAIEQEK